MVKSIAVHGARSSACDPYMHRSEPERVAKPMPYQPDKLFDTPSNPVAPIWRYMDLAKLLAILNDRALFFPSGRQLSTVDRLEGQPTYIEIDRLTNDPSVVSPDLERKHHVRMAAFIENYYFL